MSVVATVGAASEVYCILALPQMSSPRTGAVLTRGVKEVIDSLVHSAIAHRSRYPPHLLSSAAFPSLAARLVMACGNGDLHSAAAAVADGASVNEEGRAPDWGVSLPLAVAAPSQHHDVVVWLLSQGADPNGVGVMAYGTCYGTIAILQLLIDAGGDVNRESQGLSPLEFAVSNNYVDRVRVLLALPSLDFTIKYGDKTPEQYAHDCGRPARADMIAQEVSGTDLRSCAERCYVLTVLAVALADRSRDERPWYGHCLITPIIGTPCSGCDEVWCGCDVVGSRQSSDSERWKRPTWGAWHAWCVACICCRYHRNALSLRWQ